MFRTSLLSMLNGPARSLLKRQICTIPRLATVGLPQQPHGQQGRLPRLLPPAFQKHVRTVYDARTEYDQLVEKYHEAGGCAKCLKEGRYESCNHEAQAGEKPEDRDFLKFIRTSILDNRERIYSKDRSRPEMNIPYNPPGKISLEDWEKFLISRGVPGAKDPKYQRFLSKALTFPLTLAQLFQDPLDYQLTDAGKIAFDEIKTVLKSEGQNYLRICLVGVRAELSFPAAFWRELGLVYPNYHFSLIMVGPEAPLILDNQMVQAGDNVSLTCYRRFYHDIHDELVASNYVPDLFIGLNTGIGYRGYNASWNETFKDILSTKKPFVLTSHDLRDQERDVTFLNEHNNEIDWLMHPAPNKFKSLFHDVRAQDLHYIINTNWSIFAVQGK